MSGTSNYDEQVKRIRADNAPIIASFQTWLQQSGLSPKTINHHVRNLEFFTEYLVYSEPLKQLDRVSKARLHRRPESRYRALLAPCLSVFFKLFFKRHDFGLRTRLILLGCALITKGTFGKEMAGGGGTLVTDTIAVAYQLG